MKFYDGGLWEKYQDDSDNPRFPTVHIVKPTSFRKILEYPDILEKFQRRSNPPNIKYKI